MEYLDFYKLKDYPFSNAIDNKFYFNSAQHAEALLRLRYAVDTRKGLAVLVGDIGTGKTTITRRILTELDESNYTAALLVVLHSSVTTDWLLKKIAIQLGVRKTGNTKLDILSELHDRLMQMYESGIKPVVIIDEVQMLQSREIMEELRGLLNMEVSEGKLITLILCGLPELEDVIALDDPLKQRVAVKFKLSSFDQNITHEYIQHRLKVSGSEEEVFTPEAIKYIHIYSKGNPRLINTICDNAIFEGFLIKQKPIDKDTIDSVAANLDI